MRIAFVALVAALLNEGALACGGGSGHGTHGSAGDPAQGDASRAVGASHGGEVFHRSGTLYEVVESSGEIVVYAYDRKGRPLDLGGTTGTVVSISGGDCEPGAVELVPSTESDAGESTLAAMLPAAVGEGACDEFRISLSQTGSANGRKVDLLWARPQAPSPPRRESGHRH